MKDSELIYRVKKNVEMAAKQLRWSEAANDEPVYVPEWLIASLEESEVYLDSFYLRKLLEEQREAEQ